MVEQNIKDIESFYNYIKPNLFCPLIKLDDKQFAKEIWISNSEEFIGRVLEYNTKYNCYCPYRQIKKTSETTSRKMENVVFLQNFVIDIDNDPDGSKAKAFEEEYCKRYNLKIGAKASSGGGYHYYIPYRKTVIGDENRKEFTRIANSFCQNILNNKIDIDRAIFDLPRLIRIWGTWNFNKNQLCKLIYINNVTDEEVEANTIFINSLTNFNEDNVIAKEPVLPPSSCPLFDYVAKNKLTKEGTHKNDILLKNIAAYLWSTQKEDGYELGIKITELQGKTAGEFKGWWEKAQNKGFQYNCGEMYNWIKEHYPELLSLTCRICRHKNKNRVLYTDGTENFQSLKSMMIEKKKLIINKEVVALKGKIEPYIHNRKEEICVMQEYQIIKKDGTIDAVITKFIDDSQKMPITARLTSEVTIDFYIYSFTEDGTNYLLFSEKHLDYGDYFIDGCIVKLKDDLLIGNYGKTDSRRKVIFCHSAVPLLKRYKSIEDLFLHFNYSKEQLLNFLYYHKAENKTYQEPEYISNLLLAYLFSGKKSYPLHMIWNGPAGCGKSSLIEAINEKFDETNLDSGGASTIKSWVPSYAGSSPKLGSLLLASRLCLIDEFFSNVYKEKDNIAPLRMMNEILEHRERRYGSGKGTIDSAKMKAKLFAVTNPIEGTDFEETMKMAPETVMSRVFVVNLGEAMTNWVNNMKSYKDGKIPGFDDVYTWLGVYDFLNGLMSKFDSSRALEIAHKYEQKVPVYMRHFYNTRYKNHHIYLLLDGIIKTRCLFEKDTNFTAKEIDYINLEKLWESIIVNYNIGNNTLTSEQEIILELIKDKEVPEQVLKDECKRRLIDYDYNMKTLIDKELLLLDSGIYKKVKEKSFELTLENERFK